jgi:hypothetical protein
MTIPIFINFLLLSYNFNEVSKEIYTPPANNFADKIQNDSIPLWVRQLYETNNEEFLNSAIPTVTFFKKLSDSISYCLYEVNDGVCQITFVATQKNKKKYKRYKIGNECNEDFANPIYSTTTYEHNPVKRSITVATDVEKAKPKYLIKDQNGTIFKNGYNMENAETINYSITRIILITQTGNLLAKDKNSR